MKKKFLPVLFLILLMILNGCMQSTRSTEKPESTGVPQSTQEPQGTKVPDKSLTSYQASYLDLFDTVTYLKGYAADQDAFGKAADRFYNGMLRYHQLYDIYNDYAGVINIKYLNDHPGEAITVDKEIMDLLTFSRDIANLTDGKTDITLGSVLSLWHEARTDSIAAPENAYLPDTEALREAAKHTGFDKVILDTDNMTVQILDPLLKFDVGCVAKGFAVQQICSIMEPGYLVSVGGNIYATGPKQDSGDPWTIGVQDPLNPDSGYLHKLTLNRGAIVSSGDYQRYYTAGGKTYHHIIDKDTLYPAALWHGVTVICDDSGVADALSTSLFVMTREEGEMLLAQFNAEAVWVTLEGECLYSSGYQKNIKP